MGRIVSRDRIIAGEPSWPMIPTLNPSLAGALQSANNFPPWPKPIGGEGGPQFGPAKLKSGDPNTRLSAGLGRPGPIRRREARLRRRP